MSAPPAVCVRCAAPWFRSWHGRHPLCRDCWAARMRGWLKRNVKAFRRLNPGEPLPEFYAVRARAWGVPELLDAETAPAWRQEALFRELGATLATEGAPN